MLPSFSGGLPRDGQPKLAGDRETIDGATHSLQDARERAQSETTNLQPLTSESETIRQSNNKISFTDFREWTIKDVEFSDTDILE